MENEIRRNATRVASFLLKDKGQGIILGPHLLEAVTRRNHTSIEVMVDMGYLKKQFDGWYEFDSTGHLKGTP